MLAETGIDHSAQVQPSDFANARWTLIFCPGLLILTKVGKVFPTRKERSGSSRFSKGVELVVSGKVGQFLTAFLSLRIKLEQKVKNYAIRATRKAKEDISSLPGTLKQSFPLFGRCFLFGGESSAFSPLVFFSVSSLTSNTCALSARRRGRGPEEGDEKSHRSFLHPLSSLF